MRELASASLWEHFSLDPTTEWWNTDAVPEGSLSTSRNRGLSMPAAVGVVVAKGSEYILAHTELRELDGHPLGGCWSGFWSSFWLYCPFGEGPSQH